MPTYHLHLQGLVQGVGFRPYVYRFAQTRGLRGWVNNTTDGVHIVFNAAADKAPGLVGQLLAEAPALARITGQRLRELPAVSFPDFRILESEGTAPPRLLLTPDFALCDDCRRELFATGDRRCGYPFITCTNCGPRYSIIRGLPYDRPLTSMASFLPCSRCLAEYEDPSDRRFFSQTNSCPRCPVRLQSWDPVKEQWRVEADAVIAATAAALRAGRLVAIKGIGGYLLTGLATDEGTVAEVRRRKRRPHKPLAVMYPTLEMVRRDFQVSAKEAEWLSGPVAPILLLSPRAHHSLPLAPSVAPDQWAIGVMLPYAPLLASLLRELAAPIVATSGNAGGLPIAYADEQMAALAPLADIVLGNDRPIVVPQDDSVLRLAPGSDRPIILRRSRGWAPTLLIPGQVWPNDCILATGADLKSAFGLLHQGNSYLSQYLGALGTLETQHRYQTVLRHLLTVFRAQPAAVITDQHPAYFSRQIGLELAAEWGVPHMAVQHHRAHFAALLTEHQLWECERPVLGLVWDGTGWGEDGHVWGGECFRWQRGTMERLHHLAYYPQLFGDKMAREPRLAALALCGDWPEAEAFLRPHFSETEWRNYQQLLGRPANLQTASMGRLFDAVAALLGLRARVTYEGEAALLLENAAREACQAAGRLLDEGYHRPGTDDARTWLRGVVEDLREGTPPSMVAARFHHTLVQWVADLARRHEIADLAFSGGVFQNALLARMLEEQLGEDYRLYFHEQISPNDENIALGQLAWWQRMRRDDTGDTAANARSE